MDTCDYDPYKFLGDTKNDWPEDLDPVGDVLKCYNSEEPENLVMLLSSEDSIVVQRGLAIFGELGERAFNIVDIALGLVHHPNIYARSHLLDGILCYPNKLTSLQIRTLLPLLNSLEEVIYSKMITFLATVNLEALNEAIIRMPFSSTKSEHEFGLQYFFDFKPSAQEVFDKSLTASRTISAYMLASLEHRMRNGIDIQIPEYDGRSYVHEHMLINLKRILKNRYI